MWALIPEPMLILPCREDQILYNQILTLSLHSAMSMDITIEHNPGATWGITNTVSIKQTSKQKTYNDLKESILHAVREAQDSLVRT